MDPRNNAFNRAMAEREQSMQIYANEINRLNQFIAENNRIRFENQRKERKREDEEPVFGDRDPMETPGVGIEMQPGVGIDLIDTGEEKGSEESKTAAFGYGLVGENSVTIEVGSQQENVSDEGSNAAGSGVGESAGSESEEGSGGADNSD